MILYIIAILSTFMLIYGIFKDRKYLTYCVLLLLVFNKGLGILFIVYMSLIILFLIINGKTKIPKRSGIILLTVLILFIIGTFLTFQSSSLNQEAHFISNVLSPYIKLILLSSVLLINLRTLSDLRSSLIIYLLISFTEISVSGFIYYFDLNVPSVQHLLNQVDKADDSSVYIFKRLISYAVNNSVNITIYLLPIVFLPVLNNSKKSKILFVLISLVSLLLSLLTWSRTILAGLIIYLIFQIILNLSYLKTLILPSILMISIFLLISNSLITDRLNNDSRLEDSNNVDTRLGLYQSYGEIIFSGEYFFGVEESTDYLYRTTSLVRATSSENTFIEVFVRRGIIGGVLYLILIIYTFYISMKSIKLIKKNNFFSDVDLRFTTFISSIYFTICIMINSFSLYNYNLHFWLFIILIHLTYNNIKLRVKETNHELKSS